MVPFLDLKTQYHQLKTEIDSAVIDVLESGQFVLGPAVAAFEQSFAKAYDLKHAIACNSGTSALHLAFMATGIGAGDEVITTPMTFIATSSAIDLTGARPVFVDVNSRDALIDVTRIEQAITPRTKAIVPVRLYGQTADMVAINAIAAKHGLLVVEDAAQAHGAKLNGPFAGSFGQFSCFSFYPGKNLGAYGEGGLIATDNDESAGKLRMVRYWGQSLKYNHVLTGLNYRMDGIQGAILDVKMRRIEAWTEARRRLAAHYLDVLAGIPDIELLPEQPGCRHVWHVFGVRVSADRRAKIIEKLTAAGIGTNLHYPVPVHLQPCFSDLGYQKGAFPVAEDHAARQLSLPIYPE